MDIKPLSGILVLMYLKLKELLSEESSTTKLSFGSHIANLGEFAFKKLSVLSDL